jgi:glycosyltransferase involved in cell wall biosynthesis
MKNLLDGKFKVFFNWTTNPGVAYYRMISPAKYMRQIKDVQVAISDFNINGKESWEHKVMKDDASAKQVIKDLEFLTRTSDISVWQRCHNDLSVSIFLGFRDQRLFKDKVMLVEIDDDAFNVNPESSASQVWYPGSEMSDIFKDQLKFASGLIVSTEYLKQIYSEYNPHIEVVPNGIDFEIWDKLKRPEKHKNIRIGWAGGEAHEEDLKIIAKFIPTILKNYKNVEFMFYGHESRHIEYGDRVLHHKDKDGRIIWKNMAEYPQELANLGFDIGLAPLRDNYFNRAKSNLRYLEYGALKIPTVASNVEPFKNTDSSGILKVSETEDWINALSFLIDDEYARKKAGLAAYRDVKDNYNVKKIAAHYVNILKKFEEGRLKSQKLAISPDMFDKTKKLEPNYAVY